MLARLKDTIGMRLIRWGLALIAEDRAYWLYRVEDAYWNGPRGRAVLRRLGRG